MRVKRETDVLVVGAGPVGLFAALSMAERGLDVQVIDKEWRGAAHGYALALHPRTLQLLNQYGAADDLLEQGYRVERIALYDGENRLGAMDYSALGGPFPFLLVAPQSALERALEERLKQKKIKVLWNHQALTLHQGDKDVTSKIGRMEKYSMGYPIAHTEWMIAKETECRARFVVGADGYHSFVRRVLDVDFKQVGTAEAFAVFEFPYKVEYPHEARLIFHNGTTNVLWPMQESKGRWGFQVGETSPARPQLETLQELIRARAPWFKQPIEEIEWSTTVLFERRLVDRFGRQRIWLAGDAGHVTGPVGAQSMNVGLREVYDLAKLFEAVQSGGKSIDLMDGYESKRQSEWRTLLGLEGGQTPPTAAPEWTREQAARVLPCIPETGDNLHELLGQIAPALV